MLGMNFGKIPNPFSLLNIGFPRFQKTGVKVGVDLGNNAVRVVALEHTKEGIELKNYAVEELDANAFASGEIKDRDAVCRATENAIKRCYPKARMISVSLSGFSVLNDVLTMDLMPDKGLKEAVLTEAANISPFNTDEVTFDYKVLSKDDEARKMKVLLVAAKNEIIYSYLDIFQEINFRPAVMDVDFLALQNVFQVNYDANQYGTVIILNIDTEITDVVLISNGIYHKARDISVAGSNLIKALQTSANLTHQQSIDLIKGKLDSSLDSEKIVDAVKSFGEEFVLNVDLAITYFKSSLAFDHIDLMVLSGDFAWIPGLANLLEIHNHTKVEILDPFRRIGYTSEIFSNDDPKRRATGLAVATGLALRKN